MLPKALKANFIEFFAGVDRHVSRMGAGRSGHSENACTDELLKCFDTRESPPAGLALTALAFRDAVQNTAAQLPGNPDVKVGFRAERFTQNYEGKITQSDFALHLKFRDSSEDRNNARRNNWDAAYYFQAKKAKDLRRDNLPRFAFDNDDPQAQRISAVREIIGQNSLNYCLYFPEETFLSFRLHGDVQAHREYIENETEMNDYTDAYGIWVSRNAVKSEVDYFLDNPLRRLSFADFVIAHYFDDHVEPCQYITTGTAATNDNGQGKSLELLLRSGHTADEIATRLGKVKPKSKRPFVQVLTMTVNFPKLTYDLSLKSSPQPKHR